MGKYPVKKMETEEEISGKAYVHYASWHETYTHLVDADYMKGMTIEKCREIAQQWRKNILVAKDGEKVIGFAGYGAYRDETLPEHGEVYSLYVLEAYHGLQVGYDLMNAAIKELAGYKKIALWVLKGNEKAISFYKRYGFQFDGTEEKIMLGTPNTELRMVYERREKPEGKNEG